MEPKRNIPLKLISKLLKIFIKRMHAGRYINHPCGTAPGLRQEPSHNHCSLNTCQTVTLMWLCLLSRKGLQAIIWIICRKQISHFTTQISLHGWCALGTRPQTGLFSRKANLPAPVSWATQEFGVWRWVHKEHWRPEPVSLANSVCRQSL